MAKRKRRSLSQHYLANFDKIGLEVRDPEVVRLFGAMVKWSNTAVCRTVIRRFKSGSRLRKKPTYFWDKTRYAGVRFPSAPHFSGRAGSVQALRFAQCKYMKNPEYEKEKVSEDETGFSEKELDLDIEIRAGEWQNLKRFNAYKKRSRQGKIIATYQAVSNRLNQLVALYYKFVSLEPKRASKLLEELRRLRLTQEILLNCLVWEPKGTLEKSMVPKEVWDLIE